MNTPVNNSVDLENRRAARKKKILHALWLITAILVTVVMAFPVYWMLNTALKDSSELLSTTPVLWPNSFHFENFVTAWNSIPFLKYIWNTLYVTVWRVFLEVVLGVLAAYGFARGSFKGKNILFVILLGALMIPDQVTFIPLYIMISRLGWIDTYSGLILPGAVSAYFIFMMRQNFMSVDQSYLDAGKMDGLGIIGTIRYVLIPMCRSSLITVTLISFINGWNSYFWPKLLAKSDHTRVITTGLVMLRQSFNDSEVTLNSNVIMAAAFISVLPIIIVFFANQKYMLTGYSKAAMK